MPAQAPPVRDERDAVRAYLVQQQDAFRVVVHGLRDEQAGRAAGGASVLTLGALLKHVTAMQEDWLACVLAAPGPRVDERPQHERYAAYQESWTWHDHDTLVAALAAYDDVGARVLDAVERLDPDTPVPVPPAPWNPTDVEAWSVRWVWFHLLEELARHAGHADLVREGVDGATMYALVAAREGWPATEWLTPWTPSEEDA